MGTQRVVIRRGGDRPRGFEAPVIEREDGELCWDTRSHQGSPPASAPRQQREQPEWEPERQPPRPAPFLKAREDAEFGGRLARSPQLQDARETAVLTGTVADPAQGHTAFLTVPVGGTVTLVAPTFARAVVPEPGWDVEGVDEAKGHILREREPQPLTEPAAASTGMTVVLTTTGAAGSVQIAGPAALPNGETTLPVSGGGRADIFAAVWHPQAARYIVIPGPTGYSVA